MYNTYPQIHASGPDYDGYDGEFTENMTACEESYIGEAGGREGVRLEVRCLVTGGGVEPLSTFPYEADLMASDR